MCVVRGYVERIGERAYTAQPSGSGRYPHRRLNMWRGSSVSQGERERESCVWGGMMRGRATRGCIRGSGLALM